MITVLQGKKQTTNQITGNRRWWALAAVGVTMFFAAMNQTVVSTALPTIVANLHGFSLYAWVLTAYILTSAVTVPIYGKLSDMYGRKPFYLFGLIMFMAGAAVSGLAHSMEALIAARAVQGIGGGAMLSMPRATIGDIFNPRERGRWMGLIVSIYGLASIIGPTLGGWITDTLGWRWVFYINLPFGLAAFVAVFYALPWVRTEHHAKLDWTGSLLLVLALLPILLAFTWAGNQFTWSSPQILGLLLFGIAMLTLFIFNERHVEEPLLAPFLFANPIFRSALAAGLLVSMAMFGSLLFLPLFAQSVLGLSAQGSGIVLTPMMLSFITGSFVGGQIISRTGRYKAQAVIGSLILLTGTVLLFQMDQESGWPVVVRNMVILGIGIGTILPLLSVAIQNAFPYRVMGVVNSTQQFTRSLGAVIAAPILGTILNNQFGSRLQTNMPQQLKHAIRSLPAASQQALLDPQSLTSAHAQEAIRSRFAAFGQQSDTLYHQFIQTVRTALAGSFHVLFSLTVIFAAGTLIACILLKEVHLKQDEYYQNEG